MNARDNTITLRVQIATHLDAAGESPAGKIAKAVGKSDYPSVVVRELNAMRTDGLVECEQRGKKKELAYWLAVPLTQIVAAQQTDAAPASSLPDGIKPGTRRALVWDALSGGRELTGREIAAALKCPSSAVDPLLSTYAKSGILDRQKDDDGIYRYRQPTSAAPQPEVGQNTGSSASVSTSTATPAEGAAVHQPAPAAAEVKAAAPAAEDDKGMGQIAAPLSDSETKSPQYDPDAVSFDPVKRAEAEKRRADDAEQDRMILLNVLADIRKAAGDPTGKIMLDDLAAHIGTLRSDRDDTARQYGIVKERHDSYESEIGRIHRACSDAGIAEGLVSDRVERLAELATSRARRIQALMEDVAAERQAREALQEQLDGAQDVKDAAAGYLVKVPKRRPRVITKPESARAAALAAAKSAGRADVLALVPVGSAVRGAEWREAEHG